jgi:undecaprenyl-diphosphatase
MDWSLFHALNGPFRGNDPAQDAAELFNAWAILILAGAAALTWLFAPPHGPRRSKLAAAAATLAALVGLLTNAALSHLWDHARPFADHPKQTVLLVHHGADNSFPSDHATVAFAIAFAVLAFHRRLGTFFLVLATLIGLDRILVGVHYPVDVMASAIVGFASALLVTTVGRPYVNRIVDIVSRITDPVVESALRRLGWLRRARLR